MIDTPSRWRRPFLAAVGAGFAFAIVACNPQGQSTPAPNASAAAEAAAPVAAPRRAKIVRPDLPTPPGIEHGELTRHTGEALVKAKLSLDAILERLPAPTATADSSNMAASDGSPPVKAVQTYAIARAAYEEGELQRAFQLLLQVVQADPHAVAAFRLLGRISLETGTHARAGIYLNQALALAPNDPATLHQIGRLAFQEAKWSEAIAAIGHARKLDAASVEPAVAHLVQYQLGVALIEAGYDAAAVEQLDQFLDERRGFDRSSRYLRHMAALFQREPTVHVQIGDACVRLGRLAAADERYQRVAQDETVKPGAILPRLTFCDLAFGDDDAAVDRLLHLDWRDPPAVAGDLVAYTASHIADRQAFVGRLRELSETTEASSALTVAVVSLLPDDQAEAYLTERLAKAPDDEGAYGALVKRLLQRDAAKAVADTVGLIANHPEQAAAYARQLIIAAGDDVKVIPLLDALGEGADAAAAAYLRGAAYQRVGQVEPAEKAYAAALAANPDLAPARLAAIELKLAQRDYTQALRMIDESDVASGSRLELLRVVALDGLGRYADALERVDQLLADQPRNTDYLLRRALLFEKLRRFDEVEATVSSILKIDPALEPAYTILFRVYRSEAPDARKFLLLLRQLQQVKPLSRLARYQTAYLHVVRNELDDAEGILRELLTEEPKDIGVLRDLVSLLGRESRWADAQTLLLKRLAQSDDDPAALEMLRLVSTRTGDLDSFYKHYETYLKRQDDSSIKYLRLGGLYYDWGRLGEAIDMQRRAMELDTPERLPEHRIRLAEMLREADRNEDALKVIDLALDAQPDRAVLYRIKARALAGLDREADAAQLLRDALDRTTDDPVGLRVELANAYVDLDQLDAAVEQVNRAISEAPQRAAELNYRKSHLYVRADRHAEAEDALKAALAVDSNFAPANNDLGYTWADRGEHLTEARTMIAKAVAAQPENAAYLDSMGWVLYKLGEFAQAVEMLEKAVRLPDGQDATLYDHLGDARWHADRKDDATASWRKSLELMTKQTQELSPNDKKLLETVKAKLEAVEQDASPLLAPVPPKPEPPSPEPAPEPAAPVPAPQP